jgi:hypothetical protein
MTIKIPEFESQVSIPLGSPGPASTYIPRLPENTGLQELAKQAQATFDAAQQVAVRGVMFENQQTLERAKLDFHKDLNRLVEEDYRNLKPPEIMARVSDDFAAAKQRALDALPERLTKQFDISADHIAMTYAHPLVMQQQKKQDLQQQFDNLKGWQNAVDELPTLNEGGRATAAGALLASVDNPGPHWRPEDMRALLPIRQAAINTINSLKIFQDFDKDPQGTLNKIQTPEGQREYSLMGDQVGHMTQMLMQRTTQRTKQFSDNIISNFGDFTTAPLSVFFNKQATQGLDPTQLKEVQDKAIVMKLSQWSLKDPPGFMNYVNGVSNNLTNVVIDGQQVQLPPEVRMQALSHAATNLSQWEHRSGEILYRTVVTNPTEGAKMLEQAKMPGNAQHYSPALLHNCETLLKARTERFEPDPQYATDYMNAMANNNKTSDGNPALTMDTLTKWYLDEHKIDYTTYRDWSSHIIHIAGKQQDAMDKVRASMVKQIDIAFRKDAMPVADSRGTYAFAYYDYTTKFHKDMDDYLNTYKNAKPEDLLRAGQPWVNGAVAASMDATNKAAKQRFGERPGLINKLPGFLGGQSPPTLIDTTKTPEPPPPRAWSPSGKKAVNSINVPPQGQGLAEPPIGD